MIRGCLIVASSLWPSTAAALEIAGAAGSLVLEAAVDCVDVLWFVGEWTREVRGRFLDGVDGGLLFLAKFTVLIKVRVCCFGGFFESEAFKTLLEHSLDVSWHFAQ